jgi:hypothetical protein
MRLKSEIFASAIVRRVFSEGGFAAIERKGEGAAGAIFIRQRFRDGTVSVFGPAPQSVFDEGEALGRRFELRLERVEEEAAADLISREARFDPDLWMIEVETEREISTYLDIAD